MKVKYASVIVTTPCMKVLTVLKNRPFWQKGSFNFPGGHVEENESFIECALRELTEETGLELTDATHCGDLEGDDFILHVFHCEVDYSIIATAKTLTDEVISIMDVELFLNDQTRTVQHTKRLLNAVVNNSEQLPVIIRG